MIEPGIPGQSEASASESDQPGNEEPQFGLLDVVEAFTAMRHEWRTQSKENRELTESMLTSTKLLARIESTLDQKLAATTSDGSLQELVGLVIDLDISLQRAVNAMSAQAADTSERDELIETVRHSFDQSGFMTRWFSRGFFRNVVDSIQSRSIAQPNAAVEGIQLVHKRLRRMMTKQNLTRVETVGKVFDAETMNAISTISSDQFADGHVAEEITPIYYYQGQLVRFAEVRVAQ